MITLRWVKLFLFALLMLLFSAGYFAGYWQLEKALCEPGGFFSTGCYETWAEPLFLTAIGLWLVILSYGSFIGVKLLVREK